MGAAMTAMSTPPTRAPAAAMSSSVMVGIDGGGGGGDTQRVWTWTSIACSWTFCASCCRRSWPSEMIASTLSMFSWTNDSSHA